MFHTVMKCAVMSVTRLRCISLSPLSRAMLVRNSSTSGNSANGGARSDSNTHSPNKSPKDVRIMKWICSLYSQM